MLNVNGPNSRYGHIIYESDLVRGLQELNPMLLFPSGTGADGSRDHPQMDTKQGVYLGDRHLCSMGRGPVPEYNVWWVKKLKGTNIKHKVTIASPGWRHTFYELVERRVPGITWASLSSKFGIEYKSPKGGEPTSTTADKDSLIREGVLIGAGERL